MPIKTVVADVSHAIFHPLNFNLAVVNIEVVLEKLFLAWRLFPVKSFRYFAPKLGGMLHGFFIFAVVVFLGRDMSFYPDSVRWIVDVRHFEQMLQERNSRI